MNTPLRVGIIGCGVIAPTHAECFLANENIEIAWACDLDKEKANALAEKYGATNVTTRYQDVLDDDDVDIITVCTDHASHAPIAADSLDAGKHVLCEKALAASAEGLDTMFAAHTRHPELKFGGIFQHRFDAAARLLRELVHGGELGDVLTAGMRLRCLRTKEYYLADKWRGTWAEEGGSLMINQAIHFLDQLAWVVGGVSSISGRHANITHGDVIETEDSAVAIMSLPSGALASMEATSSSHLGWEHKISVHGSKGSVELTNNKPTKVLFADEATQERIAARFNACTDPDAMDAAKSYYGGGHPANIADFVAAVREDRDPFVTAASARHTVDLVLGIYESHRCGGWVDVRPAGG
jgi:predicted dehydrogenase